MPRLRLLLVALVLVTVAVALFLALSPSAPPPSSRPADATGLVLRGYDGGKLAWEAEAEHGEIASAESALSGIVLQVFESASSTLKVTAQELKQEAGAITLSGDVRGETSDGVSITSDAMTWRETEHRLESGSTLLRSGEDELAADALVYDTSTREAALTHVEGTLHRESTLTVSSDRGKISQDRIQLDGSIVIASGDDALRSDSLETDLHGTEVALRGGVSVVTPQVKLTADSVLLTAEGETATGNVSVDVNFAAQGAGHGA
jgi:lipopolysaccharide export system protein LptA